MPRPCCVRPGMAQVGWSDSVGSSFGGTGIGCSGSFAPLLKHMVVFIHHAFNEKWMICDGVKGCQRRQTKMAGPVCVGPEVPVCITLCLCLRDEAGYFFLLQNTCLFTLAGCCLEGTNVDRSWHTGFDFAGWGPFQSHRQIAALFRHQPVHRCAKRHRWNWINLAPTLRYGHSKSNPHVVWKPMHLVAARAFDVAISQKFCRRNLWRRSLRCTLLLQGRATQFSTFLFWVFTPYSCHTPGTVSVATLFLEFNLNFFVAGLGEFIPSI